MSLLRIKDKDGTWNTPLLFLCLGLFLSAAIIVSASYFLKPKSIEQHNYIPDHATHKTVAVMKSMIDVCVQEYEGGSHKNCEDLKRILEVLQGTLDLSAQTSMSQSTFGLLNIGYWQYVVSGLTAVFLVITVLQTGLILVESKKTTDAAKKTIDTAKESQRAHVFGMAYAKFGDPLKTGDDRPAHVHHADTENGHFTYWATIENAGQTPARSIKYTFTRDYGSKEDAFLKESREIGSLGAGESRKIFSYTDDTTGSARITELDRPRDLKIRIAVSYTDVFGVRHGPTISNCRLQFGVEAHGTFRTLTKDEVMGAISDPDKSRLKGFIYWKFNDLRDVWMRVRQTTAEERKEKRKKT